MAVEMSADLLYQNLISYQKVEDYESMIRIVENFRNHSGESTDEGNEDQEKSRESFSPVILYFYAFALSRRNLEGDRDKSLDVIKQALSLALKLEQEQEKEQVQKSTDDNSKEIKENNRVLELFGLCGRIYKNKFIESDFEDKESLNMAIDWYRKAFGVRLNEFAGINLATLLVASGLEFENSEDLQNIGKIMNDLLEKKDSAALNYWDLATILEFSMITQNYEKAIEAALKIFHLRPRPTPWHIKSTMGNINLVLKIREKQKQKTQEESSSAQENTFKFWIEYLQAFSTTCTKIGIEAEQKLENEKIPVLIEHETCNAEELEQKYLSVELDQVQDNENETDDDKKMENHSLRLLQGGADKKFEEEQPQNNDGSLLINSKFISISKTEEDENEENDSRQLLVQLEDSTRLKIHLPNSNYREQIIHLLNLK